jgi:glycosyltransferase involved in cell wall biosynthesis
MPGATPSVSVVVPAFNRAGSIRMSVESILRQTFTDFELLVVDDGSTDGTMDQLTGVTDPRLQRLANPRNMGAGAARNTGIRAARSSWVAFQDSDDEWLPQKLEKQMARLGSANADVVGCYCGMLTIRDRADMADEVSSASGGRIAAAYVPDPGYRHVEGDILATLLQSSLVSTQMLVARRETLLAIGGFDESLPALEDWECAIRLAKLGHFAFVDEPLVLQFFSDNSLTRSRRKRAEARARIVKKHHALFADHPKILSSHYVSVAGDLRRLGEVAAARSALGQALRVWPFDPKTLGKWAFLALLPRPRGPST